MIDQQLIRTALAAIHGKYCTVQGTHDPLCIVLRALTEGAENEQAIERERRRTGKS